MKPPKIRTFLGALYAYAFLFDFVLCYAVYTAYFELKGLSFFEIGLLLAFWSGSALVLEMATGALSDWLDRRWLMVAAPLFKIFTFVAWALADGNFWLYGLGFLMWSVGQSLFSGTVEALLYERLEHEGDSESYDRHYGRLNAVESLAVGISIFFGGFVAAYSFELSIWLSIPPLIVGAMVAMVLVDVRRMSKATAEADDDEDEDEGYWVNFGRAWEEFRRAPQMRFLLIYIAVGLVLFEELEEFDQLFYLAVDLPIVWFGVVGGVALGVQAALSAVAHRFSAAEWLAWSLPLGAGLGLIVAAWTGEIWSVVLLEAAYLISVPAAILSEARFQASMEGRGRATVTSALYFAQNVMALTIAAAFGLLADLVGILPSYAWAGLVMVPVAIWVYWQQRRGFRVF